MTACTTATPTEFGQSVLEGLSRQRGGKRLASRYFYDDLGSALFEAITLLPEYGLTRADERLLFAHASDIAEIAGKLGAVAELGSGSGKKSLHIIRATEKLNRQLVYSPIDVSNAALSVCEKEIGGLCEVEPICLDWIEGLQHINRNRRFTEPMLLLFLGSSIGNMERSLLPEFVESIRRQLHPGDYFLLGADLVKDIDHMLAAYDDPIGVTAAFNLNLLGRINRELDADVDISGFAHEVRWDAAERRIEMHLLACRDQKVTCRALDTTFTFEAGETIWTESSHKFTEEELTLLAENTGFLPMAAWVDSEWPFAEVLWRVS